MSESSNYDALRIILGEKIFANRRRASPSVRLLVRMRTVLIILSETARIQLNNLCRVPNSRARVQAWHLHFRRISFPDEIHILQDVNEKKCLQR